jgi:Domain of unknown function (DUF4349)/Putative zinc-finger
MSNRTHPFEPEEVMAYLDGELAVERARSVAAHLEECGDCQKLAAELRSVSLEMQSWQVEPPNTRLDEEIAQALEAQARRAKGAGLQPKPRWSVFSPLPRRWAVGLVAAASVVIVMAVYSFQSVHLLRPRPEAVREASRMAAERALTEKDVRTIEPPSDLERNAMSTPQFSPNASNVPPQTMDELVSPSSAASGRGVAGAAQAAPAGPMIVRTAALTISTGTFDAARQAVDRILRDHHGYAADLQVDSPQNAGRTLTATLRVPASELDATLAELKKLGRVEQESQSGNEVTRQYTDLSARLSNSRTTEQRLLQILQQRAGKMQDVLSVEQEIDRVRGDIEQMEAEKKNLENQVQFATLNLKLNEEYKASLEITPPSTGSRLHNAAVEGWSTLVDSAVSLVLFLLADGPVILLWLMVFGALFLLLRRVWRRARPAGAPPAA